MSLGSPPHTWRKHYLEIDGLAHERITSTYVEKTQRSKSRYSWIRDHLHIRGENDLTDIYTDVILGSPPHTWRKH